MKRLAVGALRRWCRSLTFVDFPRAFSFSETFVKVTLYQSGLGERETESRFLPACMKTSTPRYPCSLKRRKYSAMRSLSDSEDGMGVLQVVMLLAIGAVCLIAIKQWWIPISKYFNALFELLLQR